MTMYQGNEPDETWDELMELREFYGSGWKIFIRDTDPSGRYVAVKLCSIDKVENKGNYWMFWDKEQEKLKSRAVDAKLLRINRPELYQVVINNLQYL